MAGSWNMMPDVIHWWKVTSFIILTITLLWQADGTGVSTSSTKSACMKKYEKIKDAGCSRERGFSQRQALDAMRRSNKSDGFNMSLYLTSVVVNLTEPKTLKKYLQPNESDTFIVTVFLGHSTHGKTSTFQYTPSLGFTVYRALLDPPIRVHEKTEFRFTVHLNNNLTNLTNNWHPPHQILSTTYIDVYDFCTDGMHRNCTKHVQDMYTDHPECGYIDQYDFVAKYWYCQNNSAPDATTHTGTIPWDDMRNNHQPGPIFTTTYVNDADHGKLDYQLVRVRYDTEKKRGQNVSFTSQYNCSFPSRDVNNTHPPYFCIDRNSGVIYSTKTLIANIEPIDDFILSIDVRDFDTRYPPRMLSTDLTLKSASVCRKEYAAFRPLLEDSACDRKYYNVSIAKDFKLDTSSLPKGLQDFYISGIIGNRSAWNGGDDGFSSRANLTITIANAVHNPGHTQKAVAKFYDGQYGDYVTFRPPIRYKLGDKLTVESNSDDNLMAILHDDDEEFEVDQWTVVLIEDKKDYSYYCDNRCSVTYIKYAVQYKDADKIKCENNDIYGFDAKYGYCKDTNFTEHPKLDSPTVAENAKVTIKGCKYEAQLEASDVYWLKDGETRLDVADKDHNGFIVPPHVINKVTTKDAGSYQCVVVDRGRTIKSNEVFLKIKGNAIYRVSMTLLKYEARGTTRIMKWTSKYGVKDSEKYKKLKINITKSVNYVLMQKLLYTEATMDSFSFTRSNDSHVRANFVIYVNNKNVPPNKILEKCIKINDQFPTKAAGFVGDFSSGRYNVIGSKVTNYDCCNKDVKGNDNLRGKYTFEAALVNSKVNRQPCKYPEKLKPSESRHHFTRKCIATGSGAVWSVFNVSMCSTKDPSTQALIDLNDTKVTPKTVKKVSKQVAEIANNSKALANPVNIKLVADIVSSVVELKEAVADPVIAKNIIGTIGSIVVAKKSVVAASSGSSTKIRNSLKLIAQAQKPKEVGDVVNITTSHLALGVLKPFKNKPLTIISPESSDKVLIKFCQDPRPHVMYNEAKNEASITLPEHVLKQAGDSNIYSYVYASDSLFLGRKDRSSISYLISATVGNKTIEDQSQPITMHFALKNETRKGNHTCMFWKQHNDSSGHWSSEGCNTTTIYNSHTKQMSCSCDHLTTFSILFDVDQTAVDDPTLSVVTTVGCAISVVGLVLTIITNLMFKDVRKRLPTKILINLAFALMMMMIVFMCGSEKTTKPSTPASTGCRTVAALIQYFMLATFFWMAIEGVNLYRSFVKVFTQGSSNSKFLRICIAVGWGGPLIITIPTAAARWNYMGPGDANDPQFCVLRGTPFYVAVLAPICIIILGNFILLVIVLRAINARPSQMQMQSDIPKENRQKIRKLQKKTKVALACASLLGSSWIFGLIPAFGVPGLDMTFKWLFAITNSLQGAFLFYFYTFTSKKIREKWMALFKPKSSYKSQKYSGNSSVMSNGNKVRTDTVITNNNATLTTSTLEIAKPMDTLNSTRDTINSTRETLNSTRDTLNSTRDTLDTSKSSGIPSSFPKFKMKRAESKKVNRKTT